MNRKDFYFKQKVSADQELDPAFDAIEAAINRVYGDLGLRGILYGATVNEHAPPNFTVDIPTGIVADKEDKRISWSGIQNLNVAVDENGLPTAVGTSGWEKWLSVFAEFKRDLSDPRVDGERQTVFFVQNEDFQLNVAQGSEAPAGTATKQPLRSAQILLSDIKLVYGQTTIQTSDIDTSRREWAITASSAVVDIKRGQVEEALQDLADAIETATAALAAHIAAAADQHLASAVNWSGGPNWKDGTTNPATSVELQLDKIITDLARDVSPSGIARVGAQAQSVGAFTLGQGSAYSHIQAILGHLNTNYNYGGGDSWHDGTANPATTKEAQLTKIVTDLVALAGSDRIGSAQRVSGTVTLPSGSIWDQIGSIATLLDGLVKTGPKIAAINWDVWIDLFGSSYTFKGIAYSPNSFRYVLIGDRATTVAQGFWTSSGTGEGTAITWGTSTPDLVDDIDFDEVNSYFIVVGQISGTGGAEIQYSISGAAPWVRNTALPAVMASGNARLYGVAADGDVGNIVACGRDNTGLGHVLYATNPAASFQTPSTPPNGAVWYAVDSDGGNRFVVVGAAVGGGAPAAAYSSDGGKNWSASSGLSGTAVLRDVIYDSGTFAFYASDDGGNIWKSTNGGVTWNIIGITGVTTSIWAISSDDEGTLLALTANRFYVSQTGGTIWEPFSVAKGVETMTGVNQDRLLHYANGRFFAARGGDRDVWYSTKAK